MQDKFTKNTYFLAILIMSMRASIFYNTKEAIVLRIIVAVFMMLYYRIRPSFTLFKMVFVWSVFVLASALVAGRFVPTALARQTMIFFEAYVIVRLFGEDVFRVFVKWMVILSIISLIGWIVTVFNGEGFYQWAKHFDIAGGFRETKDDYAHLILYTVRPDKSARELYFPRNAGFTWEPGPFAILLVITLFIKWSLLKEKKASFSSIILLTTLLTTFSTTGYLTFFAYLAYEFAIKSKQLIYVIPLILLIVGGLYVFNKYNFLGDKFEAYSSQEAVVVTQYGDAYYKGSRLAGLTIVLQDLSHNPIMGKALSQEGVYEDIGVVRSGHLNALFTIASSMGLFGLFWWFYFLIISSKRIDELFKPDANWSLVMIIVLSSFGFNLHIWSILWVFLLYGLFDKSIPHIPQIDSESSVIAGDAR